MNYLDDLFGRLNQLIEKAIVATNKNHDIKYEIMIRKHQNSDKIVISSAREHLLVFAISLSSFRKSDGRGFSDEQVKENTRIATENVKEDLRDRIFPYSQGGIDYTVFIQQGKMASVQLTQHESRLKLYDSNGVVRERESVSC